ncbi:hypothetical protein ABWH97_13925 [Nitratireductor sp. ac15]
MAQKWLIEKDDLTGIETWFHTASDGKFTVEDVQPDVSPTLDRNKASYNDNAGEKFGDMRHIASIPLSVYWELERKGITKDDKAFSRWLNDPDNRFFRTFPGKV